MALKRVTPKHNNYGLIQRGTSLTIPVKIMTPEEDPVDLTDYSVAFTVKPNPLDFDSEDKRAYIAKDFAPQNPTEGIFYVQLSSEDLNFEPGNFFFDIELYSEEGAVCRLGTFDFALVGGPTNRTINSGVGQLSSGDTITVISLTEGAPIVVIAPITGDATTTSQISTLYQEMVSLQEAYASAVGTMEEMQATISDLEQKVSDLDTQDA